MTKRKAEGQRRWAESGKEVLGSKRRGTRYNGMQSTTYGIVDECTYRVFRGSEGAWVGGYGCAMAGWLGGCTSDRTPQAPGTDRSAWADGAGFPDGRWPFRTWSVGWPVGASRTSTPPPVESLAARCVGGTAGPSIASQETLGRGGGLELRPSSLGWVGLWFGQDGKLSQAFQFVLDTLTRTAPLNFGVGRPGLGVVKPCLFDIPLPPLLRCPGHPPIFADCSFPLPSLSPFLVSQARRPEARCPPPFRLQPTPSRRWLSWRSPSCIDAHVPEQGPSTATLPSLQLLRPCWLPVLSVRSQPPPPSTKLTAQAGWRIGSE